MSSKRPSAGFESCRRMFGIGIALVLALIGTAAISGPVWAQNDDDLGGVVYVGTNEGGLPGQNAVRAFRRDNQGLLSDLQTIFTGGTGVHPTTDLSFANLGPFDSDQCMILISDRNRLFVTNSGSDTIAVFNLRPNGRLVKVKGSPFPSFGVNPVSVGLSTRKDILMVANKAYDLGRPGFDPTTAEGNYTTFRVKPNGELIHVPHSIVPAGGPDGVGPGHATPTQALISPDGRLAFDANFFGLKVRSFRILDNGRLDPADSVSIPTGNNPPIPLGLQVHPTKRILYVGFVLDSSIGVYEYDEDGMLEFVRSVTYAGNGPCWLVMNAQGTRLYASNNFDNTIAVFDTSAPYQPNLIQTALLAQGAGGPKLGNAAPFQLALDGRGGFLHVVTQAAKPAQNPAIANGLNVLKVNQDGTLTLTDFVALPSTNGSRPQGVAAP